MRRFPEKGERKHRGRPARHRRIRSPVQRGRRRHRDRRSEGAHPAVQPRGLQALRLRGTRTRRAEREHPHARTRSRPARRLHGPSPLHGGGADHRQGPRTRRPAEGRDDLSAASFDRTLGIGARPPLRRDPARPVAAARGAARARTVAAARRDRRDDRRNRPRFQQHPDAHHRQPRAGVAPRRDARRALADP